MLRNPTSFAGTPAVRQGPSCTNIQFGPPNGAGLALGHRLIRLIAAQARAMKTSGPVHIGMHGRLHRYPKFTNWSGAREAWRTRKPRPS